MSFTVPSSWSMKRLGDLTTKVGSGATPRGGKDSYKAEGIPLIRSLNVYDLRFEYANLAFIDENQARALDNVRIEKQDVLLNITGASVARCGRVPTHLLPARVNQHVSIVRPDTRVLDPGFLAYCLCSPLHKARLLSIAQGGATREALTREKINNFIIPLPPLFTQRKIAAVLSAYVDLIENNTRRIKILEEMAQMIYREWFVNFRFPGHEKVKMVDSPLGKIPEGWEASTVGEILEHHIGGGWGKAVIDGQFAQKAYVVRGTDIPGARQMRLGQCPLRFHKPSNYVSRKLISGDIVFEVSGGSKDQPLGRSLMVSQRLLNLLSNEVICASFCKLVRADKNKLVPEILYFHFLHIYENRKVMIYQVQSTGISNFKWQAFLENEIILKPPDEIQQQFVSHIEPILETISNFGARNMILRATRDLLLPKLISGEVDVSDLDIDTEGLAS